MFEKNLIANRIKNQYYLAQSSLHLVIESRKDLDLNATYEKETAW